MRRPESFGVDIGGVIIDRVREDVARGAATNDYTMISAVPGALSAVATVVKKRFGDRVWLVSRCDEDAEPKILDWLARVDFFGSTGVASDRVRFCRRRDDKAPICQELGITHFIDDRLEVLSHLVGKVEHLYLFRSRVEDVNRFRNVLPHVHRVNGWNELLGELSA